MLFHAAVRNQFRRVAVQSVRFASTKSLPGKPMIPSNVLSAWYNTFGKSNAAYVTWIIFGILFAEAATGAFTDSVWYTINKGKTYDQVDWSKFKSTDEEEEEEEAEEEGDDDE